MKRFIPVLLILLISFSACMKKEKAEVQRPKLVIGLVIDQMRWDYLYRYNQRYGHDGFKRLMGHGFNCENTMINYLPAFTGPGHTCIYTGSVPSIHGIAANDWIENLTNKPMYCVQDTTVHGVGSTDKSVGQMSPRNLLTTTITDELRLATNLRSRVYGISIKDRGAILPAGHLANGAYWYDENTGNFISSSYYSNASPQWLQDFNKRRVADSLLKQNWTLLYPANTYIQSTVDATNYEKGFKGEKAPVFPHTFDSMEKKDAYTALKTIPAGNTIALDLARECIAGEKLGQTDNTDFLCVSLSATDYAGHQFGPNAIELEDMYLRLDNEIAMFLNYLDKTVGKGNYLFFLTADHGAAHNSSFLTDLDIPAGNMSPNIQDNLNAYLDKIYGKTPLVANAMNYQLYLNEDLIASAKLDREKIKTSIKDWFKRKPEVAYIVDFEDINKTPLPEPIRTMVVNGYYRLRSGDMQVILNPGWYDYSKANGSISTGTTHGTWNPYDAHIPLLWYGWHVKKGKTFNTIGMTDIAPTLAAMLHIQMPNGCIGKVIPGLMQRDH